MIKKLPLLVGLLLSGVSIAQDIDYNSVRFSYIQLPSNPLKGITNYQASVSQKFEDVIKTKTDLYNQEVAAAEEEYKKALELQTTLQKAEDEKYTAAMNAWNKKPKAEQILFANQFPQRTVIPAPIKRVVPKPDLPKTYDSQLLAGKYIKIEGLTNATENAMTVSVNLYGFNSQTPVLSERITQKAVAATSTTPAKPEIKKYYYSISYKHMMSYKIEVPGKGVISEQFPNELDNYKEYRTSEYDSVSILQKNWALNQKTIMEQIQDKAVYQNLEYINEKLNDKYGYVRLNYDTELGIVDEKKDYQDYKEAYVAAENAYKTINSSTNKADAFPELNKAIGIWENAMKESQPNNKKARVDHDVTEMTILNLIEAYIWKDDYLNAKAYIDKMKTIDPSKKGRRRLERMELLFRLQKERYDVNQ